MTKTSEDIRVIAQNAKLLYGILQQLSGMIQHVPGLKTRELDHKASCLIADAGAEPLFLGYEGFPYTLCVSVNEEVVHGFPSGRKLKGGDLVKLDLGLRKDGWCADLAITVPCGHTEVMDLPLLAKTHEALFAGCAAAVIGNKTGDISHAIESSLYGTRYNLIHTFGGHSIGRELHELPRVPNHGEPGTGTALEPGMVLCIEPMVVDGSSDTRISADGWTVFAKGMAAHMEEMVLITEEGPKLLRDYVQA